jgi:hypothetical protein
LAFGTGESSYALAYVTSLAGAFGILGRQIRAVLIPHHPAAEGVEGANGLFACVRFGASREGIKVLADGLACHLNAAATVLAGVRLAILARGDIFTKGAFIARQTNAAHPILFLEAGPPVLAGIGLAGASSVFELAKNTAKAHGADAAEFVAFGGAGSAVEAGVRGAGSFDVLTELTLETLWAGAGEATWRANTNLFGRACTTVEARVGVAGIAPNGDLAVLTLETLGAGTAVEVVSEIGTRSAIFAGIGIARIRLNLALTQVTVKALSAGAGRRAVAVVGADSPI